MRKDKTIKLLILKKYEIIIDLAIDLDKFKNDPEDVKYSGGDISSNLDDMCKTFDKNSQELENLLSVLLEMILIHAMGKIDVTSKEYIDGINKVVKVLEEKAE